MTANKTDLLVIRLLISALNILGKRTGQNMIWEHKLKLSIAEKYLLDIVRECGHDVEYKPGKGYVLKKEKSKSKINRLISGTYPLAKAAAISILLFPFLLP